MKLKIKIKHKTKRMLIGMAFVSLWVIGFAVFTFYPILQTLIYSFNKVAVETGGISTTFLGIENYWEALFVDTEFLDIILEYLLKMAVELIVIIVVSLLISILLNSKLRGTSFFRTVFFLPVIITSGPVIRLLIELDIASLPGVANMVDLGQLGGFLPDAVINIIGYVLDSFIMLLWYSGIQILIFLAALQKMDKNMYEAASIDGASKWEKFWKLTLPALNPMIILNVVFTIVAQSLFALNPVIMKIREDIYALGRGYGYASAEAWLYFIVLIAVLGVSVLIVRKREKKHKAETFKAGAVI